MSMINNAFVFHPGVYCYRKYVRKYNRFRETTIHIVYICIISFFILTKNNLFNHGIKPEQKFVFIQVCSLLQNAYNKSSARRSSSTHQWNEKSRVPSHIDSAKCFQGPPFSLRSEQTCCFNGSRRRSS